MKKYITIFVMGLAVTGCKKSDLQLNNPNSPTPVALTTQAGIESFATGIVFKQKPDGASGSNIFSLAQFLESNQGDEQFSSVGNFGARYADQVYQITLPNGTVVPNIFGVTQQVQLKSFNTLGSTNTSSNAFAFDWSDDYYINGQCNVLLQALSNPALQVSATEKAVLQAWAYWWKGYIYSRVGSKYISGIINDAADGTTNKNYVTHDAIIAESNKNFDKATALLSAISESDATYAATMLAITPSFNRTTTAVSPAMWVRGNYTLEARNYLVNHKVADMSATDWAAVGALAAKGLVAGDVTFVEGLDPNATNDLSISTQDHPYLWNSYDINPGFQFVSERWVQDFKTKDGKPITVTATNADGTIKTSNAADQRFIKGVKPIATVQINIRSRGIQFGTRWQPVPIEDGGYWTTDTHVGQLQFANSYEENALMLAEVAIHTGNIDGGVALIDQVRTFQGAGLPATAKGLSLAAAMEELRQERRIALMLRGTAWYDLRRMGYSAPATAGGGRANAIVLVPGSLLGTSDSYQALPCFMNYDYMDYWDIPVTEISFNTPGSGSASVAN